MMVVTAVGGLRPVLEVAISSGPAHFDSWLALVRQTAQEISEPAVAAVFVGRAERTAASLQKGMFACGSG